MNLPFYIAKRYLVSKKSYNAINIISAVSIAGVCLGTMALVVVLSVFNGLVGLVESMYNSVSSDISITVKEGKVFNSGSDAVKQLKQLDAIAYYNEVVEEKALLKYNDFQCVATLKGVGPQYEAMTGFDTLIYQGKYDIDNRNIVISRGVGYRLNAGAGNSFTPVSVYVPKRGKVSSYDTEGGLNELKAYISGTFSLNEELDQYVIMSLANARELFGYKEEVSSIEIGIKEGRDMNAVRQQVTSIMGNRFEVKNREQQNALLYKTMKSEKVWVFIILVFILIVATFNVIASLTMLIIEKKKDIMILHHMGAGVSLIRKIFLTEGLLITLIGAVAGLLLGTFICWLQVHYPIITLDEGYLIDAYPVKMEAGDLILVVVSVLVIGFFAAWYPVRVFTRRHLAF